MSKRVADTTFVTRDPALASFLRYVGLQHVATKTKFRNSFEFMFEDLDNQARKIECDFMSGAMCADAQRLLEANKEIRATMRQAGATGEWKSANSGSQGV